MRINNSLQGPIRQAAGQYLRNPRPAYSWIARAPARTLVASTRRQYSDTRSPGQRTDAQNARPVDTQGSTSSVNPEMPKFSLDGLGLSRNMKIFLVVVLSIFGTMETWFYCKAIWRWWKGKTAVKEGN